LAVRQKLPEVRDLEVDNLLDLALAERIEDDDFVHRLDKLRPRKLKAPFIRASRRSRIRAKARQAPCRSASGGRSCHRCGKRPGCPSPGWPRPGTSQTDRWRSCAASCPRSGHARWV